MSNSINNAEDYVHTLRDLGVGNKNYDGITGVDEAKKLLEQYQDQLSTTPDGCTLLHYILTNATLLGVFPGDLMDSILSMDPKAILMTYKDDNPLAKLIANKDLDPEKRAELAGRLIGFMKRQGETLLSLGSKASEFLSLQGGDDDDGEEVKAHEPGARCIQEAFNFNFAKNQGQLPIPIRLLKELVSLATSDMLSERNTDQLTPLQQTVDYQLSLYELSLDEPKGQLDLARLLLDKYEDGISDRVKKYTRLRMPKKEIKLPNELSVYGWHKFTAERRKQLIGAGTIGKILNGVAPPPPSDQSQPQAPSLARSQNRGKSKSKPYRDTKDIELVSVGEIHGDLDKSEKEKTAGRVRSPHPGTPNGIDGSEKPGRQRPSVAEKRILSNNSAAEVTKAHENEADQTSKDLLKELGLRFLRSTLNLDLQSRRKRAAASGGEGGGEGGAEDGFDGDDTDDLDRFFGKVKKNYYFTLDTSKKEGYGTMMEETVDSFFNRYQYNPVLRHVTLCQVSIQMKKMDRGRQVYTDQLYFLRWLRGRGVEKILKVIVDDKTKPHRDEEIEEVLAGKGARPPAKSFDVEVLDWRKEDLCPEMIQSAAPRVRELHLQWSGRNAVLRGWSEPEGLPKLECLRTVYVYYEVTPTTQTRIDRNVNSFKKRMTSSRLQLNEVKKVTQDSKEPQELLPLDVIEKKTFTQDGSTAHEATLPGAEVVEQPWFKNVRGFVELVPDLPLMDTAMLVDHPHMGKVQVGLIDDGVDVLEALDAHQSHFNPGHSFDTSQDGPLPEHSSISGHGNFMAKSILRICPHAQIVPYRLMTLSNGKSLKPRPEPGSAAKAIKKAIDDGVDIISMSWTIQLEKESSHQKGLDELRDVVFKAMKAKKRIPLIFCALRDDGEDGNDKKDLPGGMTGSDTFRIGAADDSGRAYKYVSYSDDLKATMYLFPGVDIKDVLSPEEDGAGEQDLDKAKLKLSNPGRDELMENGRTGSSIATALAAGLAGLLIHCTKLGAYYTRQMRDRRETVLDVVEPEAVGKNGTFPRMSTAFSKFGLPNKNGLKYANPGAVFEAAMQELRASSKDGGVRLDEPATLKPIATLSRTLFGDSR